MLALSPFIVFMIVYLVGSLLAGDFYKLPLTVAFLIASAYAICITPKIKLKERVNIFSRGAGNENIMLMVCDPQIHNAVFLEFPDKCKDFIFHFHIFHAAALKVMSLKKVLTAL